jgi:hypothetical protein
MLTGTARTSKRVLDPYDRVSEVLTAARLVRAVREARDAPRAQRLIADALPPPIAAVIALVHGVGHGCAGKRIGRPDHGLGRLKAMAPIRTRAGQRWWWRQGWVFETGHAVRLGRTAVHAPETDRASGPVSASCSQPVSRSPSVATAADPDLDPDRYSRQPGAG